jgi:hypothetical protein
LSGQGLAILILHSGRQYGPGTSCSATTTHAIRATIQKAPLKNLVARYGLNQKTITKSRKRAFVNDAPMGPTVPRSTVLSSEEEDIIVTFRPHTLLPLDDCLYALQATFLTLLGRLCIVPQTPRHQSADGDRWREGRKETLQTVSNSRRPENAKKSA